MATEFGSAISRVVASPLCQASDQPVEIDQRDPAQLDSAQLDANITIALFGNERRVLLIAIAVVIAMMATIIAL